MEVEEERVPETMISPVGFWETVIPFLVLKEMLKAPILPIVREKGVFFMTDK
jgi:hypothetical protein